jgi:hypothetical protein
MILPSISIALARLSLYCCPASWCLRWKW